MEFGSNQSGFGLLNSQSPQQNAISALSALASGAPFPISNQWYNKQSFSLDGYRFIRCHFDNCQLTIAKGTFLFERCKFSNCSFVFEKEAFNVVQTMNMLSSEAIKNWPGLAPFYHSDDGTISLRQAL